MQFSIRILNRENSMENGIVHEHEHEMKKSDGEKGRDSQLKYRNKDSFDMTNECLSA